MPGKKAPPGDHKWRLLLVEDSPSDARLLMEALRQTRHPPEVTVAGDGETAGKAMGAMMAGPREQWPRLVVLDLGLPGGSGLRLLEGIRREPLTADLPVVILTSSMGASDIRGAASAHATAYFAKPLTFEGYVQLANDLVELWMARSADSA